MTEVSRRQTLQGAAAGLVLAAGLAACDKAAASGSGGEQLADTKNIPVGGGRIFADHQVVVTQPASGEFRAFSSICTHAGCLLADAAGGRIRCGCHGSEFSVQDGSVLRGPAQSPLPARNISVNGDKIMLH